MARAVAVYVGGEVSGDDFVEVERMDAVADVAADATVICIHWVLLLSGEWSTAPSQGGAVDISWAWLALLHRRGDRVDNLLSGRRVC